MLKSFICFIIILLHVSGKTHDYVEPTEEDIASAAAATLAEPVESTDFPETRPYNISPFHFEYLQAHKKATRSWDYKWLRAYAKGVVITPPVSEELQKPVENKDLEAIVGGIEKIESPVPSETPVVSPRVMRFNEWVLLNQVRPIYFDLS